MRPIDEAHRLLKNDDRDWQPTLPEDNPDPQSYNSVFNPEEDIIDPSHLTEAEFYEILAHGDQEHIDEAIRRRAEERWQQKNASEPMDLAHRLLKTDIRFGEQDEDDPNVHHIDLGFYDMKDSRELPYTDDPPFQQNANAGNRLVGYYDEDSPYYGYYDDLETTPEAERASYERKLDELDEKSQHKLIQALMNADVNNAMWSAHGLKDVEDKDAIEAVREQVKPGKLYSHDDWYKDSPLIDGEIRGPHWFYPSDRAMARNLNPEWYDAKWIDGQFNPLALAPLDQKFRMTGREGEWSIRELADEMKNASEPFEIAYRLLKMPIVPDSLKHTDSDNLYNIEGKFFDPESEETMPIFLDWYKPKGDERGDIDIGINHPEDFEIEDWDDKLEEDEARRGALQFAQIPSGEYVPGPSMNATAVQVAENFRQRGYSTAMVEMLGELLSQTGDIHINPFVDGFTHHGLQMIQGIMQKKPEMAEQLRQHFMQNMDKIPDALRNINMLNMLTSGEDTDLQGMFRTAAQRANWRHGGEVASEVANKRQDRGGYNA